jgi:hypothetical protein
MTNDTLTGTEEVAHFLDVPAKTLAQWAYLGKGPKYIRVGRYRRYRWSDVEAWLEANTRGGAA